MKVNTRIFGEIDVEEDKIISFSGGIIGFPDYTDFTLVYDVEKDKEVSIMWLQSIDEPQLALPVINPLLIKEDYDPTIEDQYLEPLGEFDDDEAMVLVTVTVPKDITKMTINLMAPLVINTANKKAAQIIVEDDVPVKFPIYDILQERSKRKGGE